MIESIREVPHSSRIACSKQPYIPLATVTRAPLPSDLLDHLVTISLLALLLLLARRTLLCLRLLWLHLRLHICTLRLLRSSISHHYILLDFWQRSHFPSQRPHCSNQSSHLCSLVGAVF
jgi:hypothetical protein